MSTAFFFLSNNFNKLLLYLWFCSVETKLWFNLILKISVLSWIIPGSSYLEWRGSVSDQPLFLAWLFPVLSCMQQDRTPCQKLLLPQGKWTHSSVLFPWTPAEVPQQDHFKNLFFVVFLSLCWQKYPICVLCGIQGHIQRKCPSRPCGRCGLPSHGLKPCDLPPVWNQHCLRCGMTGHLSDVSSQVWPLWVLVLQSVLLCWRKRWKHLTVVCWQIL